MIHRPLASLALATLALHACSMARAADKTEWGETSHVQFSRALPNASGKSLTTVIVELAPGASAAPHRHGEAFVYSYVLSGTVRSQLEDGPPTTYEAGDD